MKQIIISLCVLLTMGMSFKAIAQEVKNDKTTSVYSKNDKKIEITDKDGEVNVKVYQKSDSTEFKKVYEGIFTDGKEYEKFTVKEASALDWGLGLFKKKKKSCKDSPKEYYSDPHWCGIGLGFFTITDGVRFNDVDGLNINAERSNEFFINLMEPSIGIYKDELMIFTGLGMSWKNLHFDQNSYLVNNKDVVAQEVAPNDMDIKKARLRVFSLNVPLMIEWQPKFGRFKSLSFAAGIIGNFNIRSTQKLKYKLNNEGTVKRIKKDLNVSRLTYDFIAQVGYDDFAIFAKYSPMSLFEHKKGPNVQTASVGLRASF